MSTARYLVGDVFDRLAEMPDASVDLVLTSPPFLALRSYLPSDHPDKGKEIGSEPAPAAFIDTLLALTEEWARVLTPHGSICVELGDTYSGSGGAGGDYGDGGLRDGQPYFVGSSRTAAGSKRGADGRNRGNTSKGTPSGEGWPLAKSLCLIPELYRIALVYGFNPLTGRKTPQWRARNVVRWCRPNPPVGALGDKFRPGTSDMVVACKARDRWFDLDAVREPASPNTNARTARGVESRPNDCKTSPDGHRDTLAIQHHNETAPPLDWWKISTEPYKGSHYATWPTELLIKPILSMCPPGGTVLDPFAGSGTTLLVATGHGRNAIGIDLDARNADLARERVGMFLEVDMGCGPAEVPA